MSSSPGQKVRSHHDADDSRRTRRWARQPQALYTAGDIQRVEKWFTAGSGLQALTPDIVRNSFGNGNFRRFLAYDVAWSFAVHFASPFFTLYFLQELRFTYTFVALTGMIAALADLSAMRFWGVISDRLRNPTIIRGCSAVAVFLPLLWTFVRPGDRWIPIGLHIVGSFFWAGITLCTNNMVIRMAPREERAICISVHNIAGGSD